MTTLIQETELMTWTGHKRRDALVNWLRHHGIPYLLGNKGKICVTANAINMPLLRNQQNSAEDNTDIEF